MVPRFVVTSILHHAATETFVYVGYKNVANPNVSVVYRGTEVKAKQNIIYNLKLNTVKIPLTGAPNAQVHAGFLAMFNSNKGQVQQAVAKALQSCPQCYKVIFTGHSVRRLRFPP
jgi:hypothetical protein